MNSMPTSQMTQSLFRMKRSVVHHDRRGFGETFEKRFNETGLTQSFHPCVVGLAINPEHRFELFEYSVTLFEHDGPFAKFLVVLHKTCIGCLKKKT